MKPKKNEKKNDYMNRCIHSVVKEGKTQKQAVGQCYGMWDSYKKDSKAVINDGKDDEILVQ